MGASTRGSVCVVAARAAAAPCGASPPGGAAAASAFHSTSPCCLCPSPSSTTTTEAGAVPEPLWSDCSSYNSRSTGECGRRGRSEGGWCAWARGLGGAASPFKLCPGGASPCFMSMFRSRKTTLVKRAWKSRQVGLGDAPHQELKQQEVAQQLKVAAIHLLRRLTEAQLELLVAALDSGGGDPGECVLVPRELGEECVGGRSLPPHLLMVWVWRWPDLLSASQYSTTPLQRLPSCAARNDHVYVCANPYHWARLLQTGTSPPVLAET